MKKVFSRDTIKKVAIILVIVILVSALFGLTFFLKRNYDQQKKLEHEVAQEKNDIWINSMFLSRESEISEDEFILIAIATKNSSLEDLKVINKILNNKKEEYIAERAEFFKEFENILDS